MTAEQVTQQLAELAAKVALQVIAHEAQHGPDAQTAQLCAELAGDVDQYLALVLQALLWGGAKYQAILNTNLKTQQPFSEPLPDRWWLAVMQRVQLTDAQSEVVIALLSYSQHRMEPVRSELAQVLQQQAADTQRLEQALQPHKQLEQPSSPAAGAAGASERKAAAADRDAAAGPAAAAGATATEVAAAKAAEPAEQGAQELLQRQNSLLRRLRLHALHMAIATGSIFSRFQVVSAACDQHTQPCTCCQAEGYPRTNKADACPNNLALLPAPAGCADLCFVPERTPCGISNGCLA